MRLDTLYKRNTNPKLYEEEQDYQNCGSFALGAHDPRQDQGRSVDRALSPENQAPDPAAQDQKI